MSIKSKTFSYPAPKPQAVYFVRENEGGGEGGEGDQNKNAITAEMMQEAIAKAVEEQTKGLKSKNEELLSKIAKSNDKLKQFEGLDPVEIRTLKERLDADEDSKLLAEGKKQTVIEKYTERMRAQHQAELEAERQKTQAESQRADQYRQSVLDNQIRSVTTGLHKSAVEDALLHARQMFTLDNKGNAVQLDSDGNPVLGKDGKTPFTPGEWIELQKELKPHWFPAPNSGSGSGGARDGSGGTGKTIKRANFDKLSPMDQANVIRSGTQLVD